MCLFRCRGATAAGAEHRDPVLVVVAAHGVAGEGAGPSKRFSLEASVLET